MFTGAKITCSHWQAVANISKRREKLHLHDYNAVLQLQLPPMQLLKFFARIQLLKQVKNATNDAPRNADNLHVLAGTVDVVDGIGNSIIVGLAQRHHTLLVTSHSTHVTRDTSNVACHTSQATRYLSTQLQCLQNKVVNLLYLRQSVVALGVHWVCFDVFWDCWNCVEGARAPCARLTHAAAAGGIVKKHGSTTKRELQMKFRPRPSKIHNHIRTCKSALVLRSI
jgi:hypothetical protein